MSIFNLFKSKQPAATEQAQAQQAELGWFGRLKQGLQKTRASFASGLKRILGQKISEETLEELETLLLSADLGIEVTQGIIDDLTKKLGHHELNQSETLYQALRSDLTEILKPCEQPLSIDSQQQPYVILMVGVNGAGKTTTIGKLAKHIQDQGKTVMLAAGDTFRAAASEQLQVWGERNNIPVVAQHAGADSAAVLYDALQSAKAKGINVLIADTAGRLHTKQNLMEELKKLLRVMQKVDPTAPHEVMLVLDATTGQNALLQAKQFHEAVKVTGLTLTKLDGTAKGGIIFAIAKKLKLPIRYIGVGEAIEDLRPFQAEEFVAALFD
jgi:fused signal recognition particle receptor